MKIRLLDPGFANYTGQFGHVEFVDGVAEDVSAAEAERLASIIAIENVDTGENPSVTQRLVDTLNKSAEDLGISTAEVLVPVQPDPQPVVQDPEVLSAPQTTISTIDGANSGAKTLSYDFTSDTLAALADAQGIAGLRGFAEQYDVNGRSIQGIIDALLVLKDTFNKPAQDPTEPEVVVDGDPVVEEPVVEEPAEDPTQEVDPVDAPESEEPPVLTEVVEPEPETPAPEAEVVEEPQEPASDEAPKE
jgi:hypothetical protein